MVHKLDQSVNSTPSRLDHALALAARGLLILPLQEGSRNPRAGHWKAERTRDPDTIRAWFAATPGMNYGVSPGPDFVVLDLDRKKGKDGVAALQLVEMERGFVPDTLTVRSASGGRHIYLRVTSPVSNSNRNFPQGVDVRGADGYVVGPGCVADTSAGPREYTVEHDLPIAQCPAWVEGLIGAHRPRREDRHDEPDRGWDQRESVQQAEEYLRHREPAIEGQNGNHHTYVTGCHLREFGVSEELALEMMMAEGGWNERCEPPWTAEQLTEGPLGNAYLYARGDAGGRGSTVLDDYFATLRESGMTDSQIVALVAGASNDAGPRDDMPGEDLFAAYSLDELDALPDPAWLIRDVLPEASVTMTYGATGSLKTFLMLDRALCAAAGMPWAASETLRIDGFDVPRPVRAVIVAGEGARGLKRRIAAWRKRHGMQSAKLPVLVIPTMPRFASAEQVGKLVRTIRAKLGGADLVVVDTAMRAAGELNLSAPNESQVLLDACERIKRDLGATVTLVHHTGKDRDRGPLGAENLLAGVDHAELVELVDKAQGRRLLRVTCKKSKDGELPPPVVLEATLERLGEDTDGRPVASLVLGRTRDAADAQAGVDDAMEELALASLRRHPGYPFTMRGLADEMAHAQAEGSPDATDGEVQRMAERMRKWLKDAVHGCLAPYSRLNRAKGMAGAWEICWTAERAERPPLALVVGGNQSR